MLYSPKEFILRDGTKILLKSPEVSDARMLLDNIIKIASSTNYLLSEPEDFNKYLEDITKEEAFISSFNNNKHYLICVYIDGVIKGTISLIFNQHKKDKHRATIGIAIQKEYQDKGIGSILFDEVIDIAKNTEGVDQLELDVVSTNERAKHLYTKKGFVKTGTIPRQLKLEDGTYLDGDMMVLYLK